MWPLINRNDFQEGNFDKNGAYSSHSSVVVLFYKGTKYKFIWFIANLCVCVQIICVHLMNCILITTSKTALGNKKYKGQTIFGTLFVWWPLTMQEHEDSKGIANWLKDELVPIAPQNFKIKSIALRFCFDLISTVVSYQNESFWSKWELPSCSLLPP